MLVTGVTGILLQKLSLLVVPMEIAEIRLPRRNRFRRFLPRPGARHLPQDSALAVAQAGHAPKNGRTPNGATAVGCHVPQDGASQPMAHVGRWEGKQGAQLGISLVRTNRQNAGKRLAGSVERPAVSNATRSKAGISKCSQHMAWHVKRICFALSSQWASGLQSSLNRAWAMTVSPIEQGSGCIIHM